MPGEGTVSKAEKNIYINKAVLKKGGEMFEVDVDPDLALDVRNGKDVDMREVLKAEKIFSDVKKGLLAPESKMKELFGTSNPADVAKVIIKEGELQLTSEYRKKKQEEKRKKIISSIARNAIDPTTKLPHPPNRIEAAMKEAKVKVDDYRPAEGQVEEIVKQLQPIIPIKFEVKRIEITIPSAYAAKTYPIVKSYSKVREDRWQNDGSWSGKVEIPGGLIEEFFDRLNSLTKGDVETKIVE